MPKLTIDGKQVEAPKGTTIIQAARDAGIEVPHYCWHPGLSVAGNCRICLVEIEGQGPLQIACNTQCADNMVVKTTSDKAKRGQEDVMELLLKAGEVSRRLDDDEVGRETLRYDARGGLLNQVDAAEAVGLAEPDLAYGTGIARAEARPMAPRDAYSGAPGVRNELRRWRRCRRRTGRRRRAGAARCRRGSG